MRLLIALSLLCLLPAGVQAASSPSFADLAKLPVVRFGDPVPGKDYILLFPAGKPVSIDVTIGGSLFSDSDHAKLTVTPVREVLVYREWASLDGVNWLPKGELIRSDVDVKVPGYNHPQSGVLKVRMDLAGGN